MKRIHIATLVLLTTLTPLLYSKRYEYIHRLNNKTSQNCQNVKAALLFRDDLECQCDMLEAKLKRAAEGNEKAESYTPNWMGHIGSLSAGNDSANKAALRIILAKETDDVKWAEYEQLNSLAYTLDKEFDKAQEDKKRKELEEKSKRKF